MNIKKAIAKLDWNDPLELLYWLEELSMNGKNPDTYRFKVLKAFEKNGYEGVVPNDPPTQNGVSIYDMDTSEVKKKHIAFRVHAVVYCALMSLSLSSIPTSIISSHINEIEDTL